MVFVLLPLHLNKSFADGPAICETGSFVHIENIVEVLPYSCGYPGCGILIRAPRHYQGVPFEDFFVSRGSLENSDLKFQLKSHGSGQTVGGFIWGEQALVEQFTVTAIYKSLDGCIIHSSAKTEHNMANQSGTP